MKLFTGTFTHALDAKNRVSIPRQVLDVLREIDGVGAEVVLTGGFDGGLYLFSPTEFARRGELITSGSPGDEQVRDLSLGWFSQAATCKLDKNGRMLVPDELKLTGGLSDRVVFAGSGKLVELWSPKVWEERSRKALARYGEVAREVLA